TTRGWRILTKRDPTPRVRRRTMTIWARRRGRWVTTAHATAVRAGGSSGQRVAAPDFRGGGGLSRPQPRPGLSGRGLPVDAGVRRPDHRAVARLHGISIVPSL